MEKYRLLRESLQTSPMADALSFHEAPAASDDQLLAVHTPEYLEKLSSGRLSRLEQRRIGFPWSPEMVLRSRRSTGGTVAATESAMAQGRAVHLAGGTHHAFADHGQGYCVFNDVAVALRNAQARLGVRRAVIIDLDVHQGNGTAAIFADHREVFTFSMHGATNFPFAKTESDLDIPLADGVGDEHYLSVLADALEHHVPWHGADIAFYLAGADPYRDDRLGKLSLTIGGLRRRDQLVIDACAQRGVPLVTVMAGGYARNVEDIVTIHHQTVECLL